MDTYQSAGGLALQALGDPTRRAIFESLAAGPKPVRAIADALPVSRPAVSQHLKVLKESGLVADHAVGTRRVYRVAPEGVAAMRQYLDRMWDTALTEFAGAVQAGAGTDAGTDVGDTAAPPDTEEGRQP